jgi:predicted RNA-binding Zn-ribbon protein involved in translation (DUF1610 family)
MGVPGQCANCAAPLPPDQPAGHDYCEKCAAAWQRGNARRDQHAAVEDDVTRAVSGQCANCGAPLPPDQPAGHHYCARCAAAWQRGNAPRGRSAR